MRGRAIWWLTIVALISCIRMDAATAGNGGGLDVSVALFSTRILRALTVSPTGTGSWVAKCQGCARVPLAAPIHVTGVVEIFAGGTLRVTDDASGEERTATGLWHLRSIGKSHEIDVVLTLPSERYVAAVLNGEAAKDEPIESLRALAIVSRTYALNGRHFKARPGHLEAELCDSTECQAMLPGSVSKAVEDATQETAGETLWFENHRAEVFFSQNCGGVTEDAGAVWPRLRGARYLRSRADAYCVRRDSAAWHAEVALAKVAEIAQVEGWRVPANSVAARVLERSPSHRALRIVFTGADGATAIVSASALRFGIGRALGWNRVRSDAYEVGVRNGALMFDGRGHGHGVGLCQQGAAEMAAEGRNAREILAFYFPGTAVRISPGDDGWQESHAGPLTLRATHSMTLERKLEIEHIWSEAQRRFSPQRKVTPEIMFSPTTEVFRQTTTQPGWALASTRRSLIVLQPDSVLRARGRDAGATMLHEMLHVLVEDEASERAPLWLREGLVEGLMGPGDGMATAMPASAIEGALAHADCPRAADQAHRAAAQRVHGLVERYGWSTVRGWLSSGVPSGVK